MKTTITLGLTVSLILGGTAAVSSDLLELKNGKVLNGKYVGGTTGTIRFETGNGTRVIETAQATVLTFTGGAAATAAPASAPAPAAGAPSAVSAPAGTPLLVRLVDPVSSQDAQGRRFTTTLETDLAVNGVVVGRAGTAVYGRVQSAQQARRYAGQSALDLWLTEIATTLQTTSL